MSKSDPILTVIIPTYNGEAFIEETILSIINQNDVNVNITIADDLSRDNTLSIVSEIAKSHDNILVTTNHTNLGLMKNINQASKECLTKYLCILGQDDILSPNHFKQMISEFDNNTSFVFCNSILIDEKGLEVKVTRDDSDMKLKTLNAFKYLSIENFISSTGLVMKTESFKQAGLYPTEFKNYGEWLLWINLLKTGKVAYCTSAKAYYRKHQNNLTNTFSSYNTYKGLLPYRRKAQYLAYLEAQKTILLFFEYHYNRIKEVLKLLLIKFR